MTPVTIAPTDDLRAVLDYVQPDEERDYLEHEEDEGHIVHAIRRLRARIKE